MTYVVLVVTVLDRPVWGYGVRETNTPAVGCLVRKSQNLSNQLGCFIAYLVCRSIFLDFLGTVHDVQIAPTGITQDDHLTHSCDI